jgi:hypothetical protein
MFPLFRPQRTREGNPMSRSDDLSELLQRLESPNPRDRDLAAAELGDLLEADYLNLREYLRTVRRLIKAALAEPDAVARECMFNSLSYASILPKAARSNWDPIADALGKLDNPCLEHALGILGDVGKPEYESFLAPYTRHSKDFICIAAKEALDAIAWRKGRRLQTKALEASSSQKK